MRSGSKSGARDLAERGAQKEKPSEGRSLAGVELLKGLDRAERAALEARCIWRRYRPGERVFERGSAGREVFFVIDGAVNIVSFSPLGREITFAAAQSGGTVGEMAAIDGQPRSASVVAIEESLLAVLPSDAFIELLEGHGEIALRLLQQLSAFVRKSGERVLELSSVKATNRVYGELLRLAQPDADAPDLWAIKPLPALRDLASQAGTTREVATSALNKLYPSGLIRRKGNSLYILDREALEEIVKTARGADDG
jgi:CRP-like cAMP-binding protein